MRENPLVMCLTNTVAANMTANCLLAVGAMPAMVEEPEEAAELAESADALLVNVGTLTAIQAEAMRKAANVVVRRGVPWVLDPVAVQLLAYRREFVRELLAMRPTLVRCNAAEDACLGDTGLPTLVTGAVDLVRPSGATVAGGVAMLQAVTATGCSQGALCAAFLARGKSAEEAALAASRLMKRAGEAAASAARGPGGFREALIDELWRLSHD